jgi:hypothetical protein
MTGGRTQAGTCRQPMSLRNECLRDILCMAGNATASMVMHPGGMAEWSIATVLKTVDRKVRGFESLSLRPSTSPEFMGTHVKHTSGVSALPFCQKSLLRQPLRQRADLQPPYFSIRASSIHCCTCSADGASWPLASKPASCRQPTHPGLPG